MHVWGGRVLEVLGIRGIITCGLTLRGARAPTLKLDITRENARRHIAFGYGIHRCVGARLAELQLRVLLEEIHKRRMRVKVVGDVERVRANFVHGFRKLEVKIEEF